MWSKTLSYKATLLAEFGMCRSKDKETGSLLFSQLFSCIPVPTVCICMDSHAS